MEWSNVSIDTEITKIKGASKNIANKDPEISEALLNISIALKKLKEAMDKMAYGIHQIS